MKRRLTKLVLVILLGAVVNVAVAWGCALGGDRYSDGFGRTFDGASHHWWTDYEFASGWPLRTFWSEWTYQNTLLSLRPIWSGFAINTIFYAAILWLLTLGPFTARRMIRRKRGLCIKCGYDLRGDFSSGCPECGWQREEVG